MSKVVFICDDDLDSLFESFGIDAFALKENDNVKTILEELIGKGYGIIYILERFAAKALDEIDAIIKKNAA